MIHLLILKLDFQNVVRPLLRATNGKIDISIPNRSHILSHESKTGIT